MEQSEKLKKIVEEMANEKAIKLTSYCFERIKSIGREIKEGETKSEDVVKKLKNEKDLRLGFDRLAWENVQKNIKSSFDLKS